MYDSPLLLQPTKHLVWSMLLALLSAPPKPLCWENCSNIVVNIISMCYLNFPHYMDIRSTYVIYACNLIEHPFIIYYHVPIVDGTPVYEHHSDQG